MTQWHWNPDTYLDQMLGEIAAYPELQERAVAATEGRAIRDMLELGIGTGETARRPSQANDRRELADARFCQQQPSHVCPRQASKPP